MALAGGDLPVPAEQAATRTIPVRAVAAVAGAAAVYARESRAVRLRGPAISTLVSDIGSGGNGHTTKLLKLFADPFAQTIVVQHRDS
jgi:predicted site-specific integrase-resolvase